MTRILIAGGHGQLGQALAGCHTRLWPSASDKHTAELDHLPALPPLSVSTQALQLILLSHQELDITQGVSIARALDHYQADVVINTAAYTAVDKAESEPDTAHLINGIAPGLLATACAERGIGLIHVSTDYVFDGLAKQPYTEDAPTQPASVYGQSKLAGEQEVLATLPSAVILRTSWVFSQFGNNFLKTMLRLGQERTELNIVDDQIGGPSYAPHIAQVLLQLAERLYESKQGSGKQQSPSGVFHFAGQPSVSWYGFAQEIFDQAVKLGLLTQVPRLTAISTSQYPTPAKRPAQSSLQQGRLDALLGTEHIERNWQQGIERSLLALKQMR
ncbi:dTDP-4-dehydrorhamnose reductase [Alcaligenes faecalis]|uniref:dTDP-4-dehydrorhamnose reductase n=1 Tax=Alcaligenes faecalis TaxID=511 RepID=UPI001C9AD14E|nr:dTDP-4-dehydrorhamnose reductase [Alcaligenes faecalis]MBY6311492.1 dTDP-4-dehydrorhamnose reductase [Alcaligenes faecalis]MBY6318311.1 dTDP-4-dehydrorhamnose reductase [Alcaligenes faecalis]MBY6392393.1 dTDP-4-dehydrorhamnose reductase [Alcaligenes faecalis]